MPRRVLPPPDNRRQWILATMIGAVLLLVSLVCTLFWISKQVIQDTRNTDVFMSSDEKYIALVDKKKQTISVIRAEPTSPNKQTIISTARVIARDIKIPEPYVALEVETLIAGSEHEVTILLIISEKIGYGIVVKEGIEPEIDKVDLQTGKRLPFPP